MTRDSTRESTDFFLEVAMFFEFDDFDVRDRFFAIEEKTERLALMLETLSPSMLARFQDMCAKAYIFHDSALDGLVVSGEEISAVFNADSHGVYIRNRVMQEIRNHRNLLMELCVKKTRRKSEDTVYQCDIIAIDDVLNCHSRLFSDISRKEPGVLRSVVPLHSAYCHSFADLVHIESKLRSLCEHTEDPEFRAQHSLNQAVLFHHHFMQILPFTEGSGKIARLLMNGFLLQGGYNFSIIHSSDRQLYYETLRDGPEAFRDLLLDSMESGLESQLKYAKDEQSLTTNQRVVMRTVGL